MEPGHLAGGQQPTIPIRPMSISAPSSCSAAPEENRRRKPTMKQLRNLYPAPAWALSRLSREPQDKTWTCPQCGVVPPIVFADGWYARRPCACERAAFEPEQIRKLPVELPQPRAALTYTWLVRAWP